MRQRAATLGVSGAGLARQRFRLSHRTRRIPSLANSGDKVGDLRRARQRRDTRPLSREVDLGRLHARHPPQRALDPASAGGTGHALDAEVQLDPVPSLLLDNANIHRTPPGALSCLARWGFP